MASSIGNYEILSSIGSGRIGTVYRARQVSMDRTVALKVLDKAHADNAEFVRRFLDDARGAGRVAHAGLVQVYEVGQADGQYFCSMEYVDGGSVRSRREPMSEGDALRCLRTVADGLAVAHAAGIVHGRITPASVFVSSKGEGKLADLGMAGDDPDAGQPAGETFYRAPELASGAAPDERSDLYALGATVYRALAGGRPDGARSGNVPPLKAMRPQISPRTESIVMKLLEADPADRYASARQLVEDVDAVLSGSRPIHTGMTATAPTFTRVVRARTTGSNVPVAAGGGNLLLYVLGGAGAMTLLLGLVVFFLGRVGTPPKKSRPARQPSAAVERTPDSGPDAGAPGETRPVDDALEHAAALARIERDIAAHPRDYPRALEKLEALCEQAAGTDVAVKAAQHVTRLRAAWEKRASTSLVRARVESASALRRGEFDAALEALSAIAEDDLPLVRDGVTQETDRIRSAARARLEALAAEATARLASGDLAGARASIDRVKEFAFAPLRADAARRLADLSAALAALRDQATNEARTRARTALDSFLEGLVPAVLDRDWETASVAIQRLRPSVAGTDLAAAPDATARVVERLRRRLADARTALAAKAGERVSLAKRDGTPVKGALVSVDETGAHLLLEYVINGRVAGTSRPFISWAEMCEDDLDDLAGRIVPTNADEAIAAAFVALGSGDAARAQEALSAARGHPLAAALTLRVDTLEHGAAEADARAAWAGIASKTKLGLTKASAKVVLPLIDEFEKQHGATKYAAAIADEIEAARAACEEKLVDQRLRKGLLVHFPLDRPGAARAEDASGNGRHGRLQNVTIGKDGASYTAGDSMILIEPNIKLPEAWTVAGRMIGPFKAGRNSRWHTLSRGEGRRGGDHQLILKNTLELGSYDNTTRRGFVGCGWSAAKLTPGWHHFAAVGAGDTTTFYVDGARVGSIDFCSKSNVYCVGNYQGGTQIFAETIKDFRVYDRALTEEELKVLARPGATRASAP